MSKQSDFDILVWEDGGWCFNAELDEQKFRNDNYKVLKSESQEWKDFMKSQEMSNGV